MNENSNQTVNVDQKQEDLKEQPQNKIQVNGLVQPNVQIPPNNQMPSNRLMIDPQVMMQALNEKEMLLMIKETENRKLKQMINDLQGQNKALQEKLKEQQAVIDNLNKKGVVKKKSVVKKKK